MEKFIFDEGNGLWYELQGDYYIPCLTASEVEQPVGLWGQRHLRYISRYQKVRHTVILQKFCRGYTRSITSKSFPLRGS